MKNDIPWNKDKNKVNRIVNAVAVKTLAPPQTFILFSIQKTPKSQKPNPKKYPFKPVAKGLLFSILSFKRKGTIKANAQKLNGSKAIINRLPSKKE